MDLRAISVSRRVATVRAEGSTGRGELTPTMSLEVRQASSCAPRVPTHACLPRFVIVFAGRGVLLLLAVTVAGAGAAGGDLTRRPSLANESEDAAARRPS